MIIIGIDPGQHGGIAIVDDTGKIKSLGVMPIRTTEIDIGELGRAIGFCEIPCHIYCEHSQAIPGARSSSSTFKFGCSFGILLGVMGTLRIPFTLCKPQAWQKVMHQGVDPKLDPKKRSLIAAKRLYPDQTFLATPRCKVAHDGLIDALLIAEYGRRQQILHPQAG